MELGLAVAVMFAAALLAVGVVWSDPRVRVPAGELPRQTALSVEIEKRGEALKASRKDTEASMAELHACGARLRVSVAKGQGR